MKRVEDVVFAAGLSMAGFAVIWWAALRELDRVVRGGRS